LRLDSVTCTYALRLISK